MCIEYLIFTSIIFLGLGLIVQGVVMCMCIGDYFGGTSVPPPFFPDDKE
jgi:hypothetical protein